MSLQQQALRLLHVQAARNNPNGINLGNLDTKGISANSQTLMQNLAAAARNGQLDINNPAYQQLKTILMLSQQQKSGQVAKGDQGNPLMPATNATNGESSNGGPGSAAMPNMPNVEQMIQQAVKTQQAAQQQPGYGPGNGVLQRNPSSSQQIAEQQQPQLPANPRQNSGTDQPNVPPKIWTGDLTWPSGGGCKSPRLWERFR